MAVVASPLAPVRTQPVEPTEPTADTDEEWRGLRVSKNDVVREILAAPQNARAARLLRNVTFNPRDSYLRAAVRRDVGAVLAHALPALKSIASDFQSARAVEFQQLHAEGRTTAVDLRAFDGAVALRKIGADPTFSVIDGVTYGVGMELMPATQEAENRLREEAAALCGRLADVFAAGGTLTSEEMEGLAARTRALLGRKRANDSAAWPR